jgi:hypothetical protein
MADTSGSPPLPHEIDAAVRAWMEAHRWRVAPARWELDPEAGFYVWQEDTPRIGRSHALWIAEAIIRHLSAKNLVSMLDREGVAEEININFKVRVQEWGEEYRISPVPRRSGESPRLE